MDLPPVPATPSPRDPGTADTQTLVDMGAVDPPPVPSSDPPPPPDTQPYLAPGA